MPEPTPSVPLINTAEQLAEQTGKVVIPFTDLAQQFFKTDGHNLIDLLQAYSGKLEEGGNVLGTVLETVMNISRVVDHSLEGLRGAAVDDRVAIGVVVMGGLASIITILNWGYRRSLEKRRSKVNVGVYSQGGFKPR